MGLSCKHWMAVGVLLVGILCGGTVPVAARADESIRVTRDGDRQVTTVVLPCDDGKMSAERLLCGYARGRGLDDQALLGLCGSVRFDPSKTTGRIVMNGIDGLLGPHVHLQAVPRDGQPQRWNVQLTFDHAAEHASRRAQKEEIRARVAGLRESPHAKYGLRLDPDWQAKAGRAELVVFVHGFNSCPAGMEFLALPARNAGLPCGMIAFPNDQALADSASLVSAELKRLAARHPNCRVNLVTHSMGGLIARECVEDAKLNPGNVNRLIMVAPPNGGSQLAHFGFATDTCELIAGLHWKRPLAGMLDRVDDGLGEAVHDLRPGSPYLRKMANYERNPQVQYTIMLGTKAPFTTEQVNKARQRVAGYGQRWRAIQLFGPKLDRLLGDADELIDGRGDGAVAVKRGRLEGVADTVLLKFHHLATHPEHPEVQSLQKAVLARLVAETPAEHGIERNLLATD